MDLIGEMIDTGDRLFMEVWADDNDQCFYAWCEQYPTARGTGKRPWTAVQNLIGEIDIHVQVEARKA